jgi:diacylglycerol O-acyltransferase
MALMPITDSMFLMSERREQPMHVGSLQLFRLPEGAGPDWVPDLYDRMLQQTAIRSLFRRRPLRSLRTLGAWSWVDDGEVDLEHHVRHSALPRPGRVRELLAMTSRLHGTLLDRHRPLWEIHLIEGLEGDRFAIYTKIHHSLLDGVSALKLLETSLATDPDDDVSALWGPRPRPKPARGGGGGGGIVGASVNAVRAAGDLAGLGPALGRRAVQTMIAQGRQLSTLPPRTMLNVPITGARRYAAQSWPLDQIKTVGHNAGATVNDVVLAMCSGALREYLLSFDALPDESLVAMTPVSLRDKTSSEESGNAVGAILAPLGTNRADPGERMEAVKESMQIGKASMAGMSSIQATAMSAFVMAPLAISALGSAARWAPPPFNLVISNVPGPRRTLYLNGATLEGVYPLSIPVAGQALNITVTSYRGSMDFGLTGDRRALPHLQRMLGYLDKSLVELGGLVGV